MAITSEGTSQSFSYTGDIQTFTVPYTGLYKLEVWGGQGGCFTSFPATRGKGGYSVGYKILKKGTVLYIVCGGQGSATPETPANSYQAGGYNGGGCGYVASSTYAGGGSGGGATHIALVSGTISSVGKTLFDENGLIVAGGGGGGARSNNQKVIGGGGTGGGTSGGSSYDYGGGASSITGGTQTSGYAFGVGGSCPASGNYDRGGGGGGYYGGYCGSAAGSGGSGGSGWIGGVPEITFKGTTYSPSMSNGVNSDTGKATITLEKKGGFPIVYFDGTLLDGITFDGVEIDTIIFNGITLS